YGATWQQSVVRDTGADHFDGQHMHNMKIALSPHNNGDDGHVYASVCGSIFLASITAYVYKSTDWGQTWSLLWSQSQGRSASYVPHVPYQKADGSLNLNGPNQLVYFAQSQGGGTPSIELVRSTDGGISRTQVWGPLQGG